MTGSRPLAEADGLIQFIDASPTPYHAGSEVARMLEEVEFSELQKTATWPPGRRHYVAHGGTLIAWASLSQVAAAAPFRLVGAHTDSPNLRIRPRPDLSNSGCRQLGVEVYGGSILNSWLDRDLGLSGRVVLASKGGPEVRLIRIDRPVLRIPQLAPDLDPALRTEGLRLNPQTQLVPI